MNEIEKRARVFSAATFVDPLHEEMYGSKADFFLSQGARAARSIGSVLLTEGAAVYTRSIVDAPGSQFYGYTEHRWRVSVIMPDDGKIDFTTQIDEAGEKGRRAGIEAASNLLSTMGYDSLAYSVRMIK